MKDKEVGTRMTRKEYKAKKKAALKECKATFETAQKKYLVMIDPAYDEYEKIERATVIGATDDAIKEKQKKAINIKRKAEKEYEEIIKLAWGKYQKTLAELELKLCGNEND